jgi:hypothetical protein
LFVIVPFTPVKINLRMMFGRLVQRVLTGIFGFICPTGLRMEMEALAYIRP